MTRPASVPAVVFYEGREVLSLFVNYPPPPFVRVPVVVARVRFTPSHERASVDEVVFKRRQRRPGENRAVYV